MTEFDYDECTKNINRIFSALTTPKSPILAIKLNYFNTKMLQYYEKLEAQNSNRKSLKLDDLSVYTRAHVPTENIRTIKRDTRHQNKKELQVPNQSWNQGRNLNRNRDGMGNKREAKGDGKRFPNNNHKGNRK